VSNLSERIFDIIPPQGMSPQRLYRELSSHGKQEVDTALTALLKKNLVEKTFGQYMRVKGATYAPPEASEEPDEEETEAPPAPALPAPVVAIPQPLAAQKAAIDRSASGLREVLFGTIEDLRAGRLDVAKANAIAKTAETILKSVETQIAFERLRMDSKRAINLDRLPFTADSDNATG
jgi:hypothetical protein